MGSNSADKFFAISEKADKLYKLAHEAKLRPLTLDTIYSYYHASLAVYVSAWDAYINNIVNEFFDQTSNPLDQKYNSLHVLAKNHAHGKLSKFNTPNWDNSRNLLLQCTGFDPMSNWIWKRRGKNRQESIEFLNQILKIRHSFAHGFPMKSFGWNESSSGETRLTKKNIEDIEAFFSHLKIRE